MFNENSFTKLNNPELFEEIQKLEIYFNELLEKIDLLGIEWTVENFIDLEIKKSILRGFLRECKYSHKILKLFVQTFKGSDLYSNKIKFYTKLYPMIHLPSDKSESVGLHFDNFGNKEFYTSWTPITIYEYPALAYVKNSHKFKKLISKIFLKLNILNLFLENINVNRGEIFIWNGNMIHKGNLNSSKKVSAAFQIKFTDESFIHEKSYGINENLNVNYQIETNIEKLFDKYNELINFASETMDLSKHNREDIEFHTKNTTPVEKKILSFSLSVLAQRISTNNYSIGKKIERQKIIRNLDIFSVIFGGENLSSIDRLSKINDKKVQDFLAL